MLRVRRLPSIRYTTYLWGMHASAVLCRLICAAEHGRSILPSTLEGVIEYSMIGLTGCCMLILVLISKTFRPIIVPRLATS